ncbi:MAG: FHA domain-containing protein [Rhodothermales bacterium]
MKAKLFSQTGALAGTEFIIEQEAVVGRDTHCDITLYPHTVSSNHARIFLDEGRQHFYLEDLGSSNGTFVDKTRVSTPVRLSKLTVITFANDVDMIFQVLPADFVPTSPQKPAQQSKSAGGHTTYQKEFVMPTGKLPGIEDENVTREAPGTKTTYGQSFDALPEIPGHDDTVITNSPVMPASPDADDHIIIEEVHDVPEELVVPSCTIVINNVKEEGRRVTLEAGAYVLGRAAASDVPIKDEYMSGRHAQLRVEAGGVFLKDLESRNGTFIGERAVEGEEKIEKGTVFKLGPTTKILLE